VSGPRLALRDVGEGARRVDLLVYDDVLAVVPRPGVAGADLHLPALLVAAAVALLGRRPGRDREASPETLPRRTALVPLAEVREVVVRPGPRGAATLDVDGRRFAVPETTAYREPWPALLGPVFGDRLTVV